jgi:alkaline phosphatase D
MLNRFQKSRRNFIKTTSFAMSASVLASDERFGHMAISVQNEGDFYQPQVTHGVQIGDVVSDQAIVWCRTDRPARMYVKYSFNADFKDHRVIQGPLAFKSSDFTARINLTGLPAGQDVFFQVIFQDLDNPNALSKASYGYFRTAPSQAKNIRFLWSGDTCGQGWGINPEIGGLRIYETMRFVNPDFFIHCGDSIYADCPIQESQVVHDTGAIWRNLVTPEVAKVAETLNEFRGRYKYNLMDHNLIRFNAEVPTVWLWDDHEITNNWSPSKDLTGDARYAEKNIAKLVKFGATAAFEYAPIRHDAQSESRQIYRKLPYGPLLDIFVLDMRSYRSANNSNRQERPGKDTDYLGRQQLDWLKSALNNSTAVWKVIAADMPIGLQLGDGFDEQKQAKFENFANGDGPVLGREFEMAELLSFVKQQQIVNMVWFTADVHYCAAHFYSPVKAEFKDFQPFWEFVSGPLNAGSFSAHQLDNTFGPEVIFQKASPTANLSPLSGLQFFGQVDINGESQIMTVTLKDIDGETLFSQEIYPVLT